MKQESLRQFLTGTEDTERFKAISSMLGAGRLGAFAEALEGEKRRWARGCTQARYDLENEKAKRDDLNSSLKLLEDEIDRADAPEVVDRWNSWKKSFRALNLSEEDPTGWRISELALQNARRMLLEEKSAVEHKESVLLSFRAELKVPLPEAPEESLVVGLLHDVEEAAEERDELDASVERLRVKLSDAESQLREAASTREDLAAMANILLRHVSDSCSACGQSVDEAAYRTRLEQLVGESEDLQLRDLVELRRNELRSEEDRARAADKNLDIASSRLDVAQRRIASASAARENQDKRLQEVLAIVSGHLPNAIDDVEDSEERVAAELSVLSDRKDRISSSLEAARQFEAVASLGSSRKRRDQVSRELGDQSEVVLRKQKELVACRETDDAAAALLRAVKSDAESYVEDRLRELRPLLAQFYSAIDPHPTFRNVDIAIRQFRGKHRLSPVLHDEDVDVEVSDPGETLSTSQSNALAVSLFLAFNLGFDPTQVKTLILDDPLQNLDDVHLLGLVDLLRKILPQRQLIVTTHDQSFGGLLARKLRPVEQGSRVTFVRFVKWDRKGPSIEQWDVPAEQSPLKLVGR